ncbi:MAG: Asp-tRNA(Asn)/Glu-tRNA(Gln) amidotransferase subunit GatB [Acidobacteria bacterium]|nr:Asp-tRNA(Asn)/Glu-tRNA(Gln) amidotransferase subunit GatB [Acidobacteriota bacterium]
MEFEPIIGLEVHAQLLTRSKIFCGCSTEFGGEPNARTCPVCLGLPGVLPALNREAVSMAVKVALALNCRINRVSVFARKNYFYPDLPKGYQISQYDLPLAEDGEVELLSGERSKAGNIVNYRKKKFGIIRLHLEEDAGKSIHDTGEDTYVNLNRSGVPLIEIVSQPDFRSSQEAYDFLFSLRRLLIYLEVNDGNMEEGSLRCDANVSVRPKGSEKFGTKTEIKNLNSFRFLQKALDYEIQRQIEDLRAGRTVFQETRLWDPEREQTFVMRTKEEAHDYRYFPEPDLPPLEVSGAWSEEIRATIVELPEAKRERLCATFGISDADALLICASRELADYYETAARENRNPVAIARWLTGDFLAFWKRDAIPLSAVRVRPGHLAEMVALIDSGEISGKIAKQIFEEIWTSGEAPAVAAQRLGVRQISDRTALEQIVQSVIANNQKQVAEYQGGRTKLLGFFVGEVMKQTKGQANPQILNELLKKNLG